MSTLSRLLLTCAIGLTTLSDFALGQTVTHSISGTIMDGTNPIGPVLSYFNATVCGN